jgi:hypothetical protein
VGFAEFNHITVDKARRFYDAVTVLCALKLIEKVPTSHPNWQTALFLKVASHDLCLKDSLLRIIGWTA